MTDQISPETETPEFIYARDLLVSFVEEHCDPVPEWKPNSDLMGILMQFDNALTVVRSIKAGFDPKQPAGHAQTPADTTVEDLRLWISETYAFWIAGDLPPSHMRKGRSL